MFWIYRQSALLDRLSSLPRGSYRSLAASQGRIQSAPGQGRRPSRSKPRARVVALYTPPSAQNAAEAPRLTAMVGEAVAIAEAGAFGLRVRASFILSRFRHCVEVHVQSIRL